jgi:hypothetical protein
MAANLSQRVRNYHAQPLESKKLRVVAPCKAGNVRDAILAALRDAELFADIRSGAFRQRRLSRVCAARSRPLPVVNRKQVTVRLTPDRRQAERLAQIDGGRLYID